MFPAVDGLFDLNIGTVARNVDLNVARQEAARVEYVPEARVDEHKPGLEDVEPVLVAQEGVELLQGLDVSVVDVVVARMLDETVNAAHQDQEHAEVERQHYLADAAADPRCQHVGPGPPCFAAIMEQARKDEKGQDHDDLDRVGREHDAGADRGIGDFRVGPQ